MNIKSIKVVLKLTNLNKNRMKKLYLLVIAVLFINHYSFSQTGEDLDNENGTSMMPIVNGFEDLVKTVETSAVEIVHVEFDLLFEDTSREIFRNLSKDYRYGFMVYGDYRIGSVKIELYKESGSGWAYVKAGEPSEGGTMTLIADISETARYKLVLTPMDMKEGYTAGHYGLIVMHN
jgi:hypothetical protein